MKLNFCPECGRTLHKTDNTRYVCENGHPYYNNPRATVAIIFLKGNTTLCAKRGREPQKDKYGFVGGFIDFDESPEEAVRREVKEETGLKVSNLKLIAGYWHAYEENTSVCDFVFIARQWQGTMAPNDDVAALEWQPVNFIKSPKFAWLYPGLYEKLQKFIEE